MGHRTELALVTTSALPGNRTMLCFLGRVLTARMRHLLVEAFTRDEWNIGVAVTGAIEPNRFAEAKDIRWLPKEGKRTYLADPFIARLEDRSFLLAETIGQQCRCGVIVAYEITNGHPIRLGIAIETKNAHMSYPFLFHWKGNIYCVPEQAEAGAVVLYRAVDFPKRWEPAATILSGVEAHDPTIFRANSLWWLAYTDGGVECNTRLMLWYAKDPMGPWTEHARNPVKIDPRSSRGAGAPFIRDAMLIRPAQDCSGSYGAKIVFNRIVTLTPTEFEEEIIGELRPQPQGPYPRGLHTISWHDDMVIIDGLTRVFDPMAWLGQLRDRRMARMRRACRESLGKTWHADLSLEAAPNCGIRA
jgi:hypothetical protein